MNDAPDSAAPLGALSIDPAQRKALKADAHHLKPVVMIGDAGLTAAVLAEVERALAVHGLIKVRVHGDDREQRAAMMTRLCETLGAAPVQSIGKLLVLWRPQPEAGDAGERRGPHVPKKRAAAAQAERSAASGTRRRTGAAVSRKSRPAAGKTSTGKSAAGRPGSGKAASGRTGSGKSPSGGNASGKAPSARFAATRPPSRKPAAGKPATGGETGARSAGAGSPRQTGAASPRSGNRDQRGPRPGTLGSSPTLIGGGKAASGWEQVPRRPRLPEKPPRRPAGDQGTSVSGERRASDAAPPAPAPRRSAARPATPGRTGPATPGRTGAVSQSRGGPATPVAKPARPGSAPKLAGGPRPGLRRLKRT